MSRVIETKVIAGTVGGGFGGVLATFTLWCLGAFVWNVGSAATNATKAVEAVPAPISALIVAVVPAITVAVAGWLAPHTHRPNA